MPGDKNLIQACQYTKMKKRIALNTFYTLGIVVSIVGLKWAFETQNYPIIVLLALSAAFFLYLKIKIVKEVRAGIQEKENSINARSKDETN